MSTVADAARPVGAYPPLVRHGICRLTIRIHNTEYRLSPRPPEVRILAAWNLRKIGTAEPARYVVTAPKGVPARCTCPDHQRSGWTCKHIGALMAAGLIPGPKPIKAGKVTPARARQLHTRNARQAIGQAQEIVEARRSAPVPVVPEGWETGGAHPDFQSGFRQAVGAHVQQLRATGEEIPGPDYLLCEMCDQPFEPHSGRYREFCPECQGGVA